MKGLVVWSGLVLWAASLLGCSTPSGSLAMSAAAAPQGALSTRASSQSPEATIVFPTIASVSQTPIPTVPFATRTVSTPTSSDDALTARLVGLWHNPDRSFRDLHSAGSFYDFRADGTWHWDINRQAVSSEPENYGEWYIQDNVLYLRDTGGLEPCAADQVGTYKVSFIEQDLVLSLIQDSCSARVGQTKGRFSALQP